MATMTRLFHPTIWGGALSIANGVDTIDNLNENDADGDGKALENDAKPVAVGKNKGNDLLSADNDENGNILTAAPKTYYVNHLQLLEELELKQLHSRH